MNDVSLAILWPLAYIIPSLILYALELIIVIFNRHDTKFAGPFFTIFICSAINNMTCAILYFLTYRATKVPIFAEFFSTFPESGFFITLPIFVVYVVGAAESLFDFCICFNRFTVVFLGPKHIPFWRKWCKVILTSVFLISIAYSWEAWFFKVKILPINENRTDAGFNWGVTDSSMIPWMKIPIIIAGNVIVTASLCLLMNLYVCCFLLKRNINKRNTLRGGSVISSTDLRLFSFNLLLFGTQATHFCLQMVFLIVPSEHSAYSFALKAQFVVMDINSLASSWFLFFTSAALRKGIFRLITCGECKINIVFFKKPTGRLCGIRRQIQPYSLSSQVDEPASNREREAWFFTVQILPVNSNDANAGFNWGVTDTSAVPWMRVPIIIAGNVIITATWSFIMNLYVCWFFLKRNITKKTTVGGFVVSVADVRLFFFNLLLFGTQATQFALQMVFLTFPRTHSAYSFASKVQFVVMDINCLAGAWFILLTSAPLRKTIFKIFVCKELQNRVGFFKKLTNSISGVKKHIIPSPPVVTIVKPASPRP